MVAVALVSPLSQTKVKPPTPPAPVAVAEPLDSPLQITSVSAVAEAVTSVGSFIVTEAVAVQPFVSVAVTV